MYCHTSAGKRLHSVDRYSAPYIPSSTPELRKLLSSSPNVSCGQLSKKTATLGPELAKPASPPRFLATLSHHLKVLRILLSGWISRFSGLQTIMTDQGSKFELQLCEGAWYPPLQYEPHHPTTNSFIDQLHPMLKAAIMCFEDEQWTKALMLVLLGIHTAYKKDLQP